MSYDALNRITGKTYPAGSGMTNITYSYDDTSGSNFGIGHRTSMTDASGATSYLYDSRGRTIQEKRTIDSEDYVTGYTYAASRLTSITYPTGEIVTQTYDNTGLLNTLSGSVVGDLVTSTIYNQLGQVTQINLGNGLKTTFGYWDVGGSNDTTGGYYGRLWEIKTLPQAGGTALQDIRHTWDAGGNLTQRQDLLASETESFGYDFLDRLTSVSGAYTQNYAYNQIGNITSMNGNSYTYGAKPHAVTAVGAQSYTYDANGNMTDRNGQAITWDVENKPASIISPTPYMENFGGTTGSEWSTYQSTANGRNEIGNDPINEGSHSWSMDTTASGQANLNELVLHVTLSGASYLKLSFSTIESNDELDIMPGNFTGHSDSDGVSVSSNGSDWVKLCDYPESAAIWTDFNNLDIGSKIAITGDVYIKFQQYDDYPVPTDGIMWDNIRLDCDGTLTPFGKAPLPASVSTFVYDGDGSRVKKTEGGETILYVNQYYEKNLTTSEVTTHYYLGDKEIAYRKGATLEYVHADHLGSTSITSDSSGIQVAKVAYFSFGGTRSVTGTLGTDKMFTGQRLDDTGLYYYNARYYDATIGRFISPDSLVPNPANPQSLNRYSYCLNNPSRYTDPTGHITYEQAKANAKAAYALFGRSVVQTVANELYIRGNNKNMLSGIASVGITPDPNYHSPSMSMTERNHAIAEAKGIAIPEGGTSPINVVHGLLDAAGIIPVVGEVADGINGAIYTLEGDELNAVLSFGACLPFLGWAATTGKYVNKANNINDAARFLRRTVPLNNKEARAAAEELGFKEVKDSPFDSHGKLIFKKGNTYITPDVDCHNGGTWKMIDGKGNRMGTLDMDLKPIGN